MVAPRDAWGKMRLRATAFIVLAIAESLLAPVRFAAAMPGGPDPTFGTGGFAATSGFSVAAPVRLPDGRLVAAGFANTLRYDFQLARFDVDGSPDLTFGSGGVATTRVAGAGQSIATLLARQPDGKVVAVGVALGQNNGSQLPFAALARYNPDGTADATFATSGTLVDRTLGAPVALQLQPDGKIIVVSAGAPAPDTQQAPVQLARYNADGSADAGYARAGNPAPSTSPPTGNPRAALLLADGTLIVAVTAAGAPAVVRYDATGGIDPAFGTNGVATLGKGDWCCNESPTDIIALPDGRVAIAGIFFEEGPGALRPGYVIHVVHPDGSPDNSFGSEGRVVGNAGQFLTAHLSNPWAETTTRIALEPDGKLLQVGTVATASFQFAPIVFRYDLRGSPDQGFGVGGVSTAGVESVGQLLEIQPDALALQPDGKLVVGGPGFLARYVLGGASTDTAVEYRESASGGYFVTSLPSEIARLDSGEISGWQRTGQYFSVLSGTDPAGIAMCRFFSGGTFAPASTHFLTPYANECAQLREDHDWIYEGNVMAVRLPDRAGGCATGALPVYRLYGNGQGGVPNHRYTTSLAARAQTIADGWIAEGAGPLGVTACVPAQ